MQLKSFTIFNFRSINDSGLIELSRITALLGRNESGKSNLLLGLQTLNPPDGLKALNPIKDFPRHRRLEECNDNTKVVSSIWILTNDEQRELVAILPRANGVSAVGIGRTYSAKRWVTFEGLQPIDIDESKIKTSIRKIVAAIRAVSDDLNDDKKHQLEQEISNFEKNIALRKDRTEWANSARSAIEALSKVLVANDIELTEKQEQNITQLQELAESIANDKALVQTAEQWLISKLPIFIYLDEYPELHGHQSISEFLSRRAQNTPTQSDNNFEKMCKVAGLDPQKLDELLGKKEQETRNQLANRAGAVVTKEIRRLWKDRPLKIRFNLDADHMDTFISDPNAVYDVEVNLDERSRGFRWFFSFYITFSADTNGGKARDAILLLDEPGLYLHAKSQGDLLEHFEKDFANQIIYTTHSPFMVPTHSLDSVRTVNIAEDTGTTVTNNPTGDARTLFPLQAALGYDLAQSLFIGPNNLVIEGVTDFWAISSISEYLADLGRTSLRKVLTLTPAGGAQKVSYMVALLTSENLNVLVLLDDEKDAKTTKDELVKKKLICEKNVVFVSEAFGNKPPKEADIEDLLDPAVYEDLVKESYARELKGKVLSLNSKIPRVVKRVEDEFAKLGINFHKTRPMRLLLKKMASAPETVVTADTANRFETLFNVINNRLEKHMECENRPFT